MGEEVVQGGGVKGMEESSRGRGIKVRRRCAELKKRDGTRNEEDEEKRRMRII